ncbi:T9SS type A sorting domain-containing protein, partial [Marivirga sp. S37H4]
DPETDLPYVIGSTTTLGVFEGEVPFFVVNGSYDVMMSASVEMGEETYYIYGDEESGVDVGDLDVFLRAAELVYQGDPNATIYAGQDVTFSINIENDETNLDATADLFVNLIFDSNEGDIVLATQQGMGDITIALPTDYSGTGDFRIELSEDAPLAEVGTLLENSDFTNLNRSSDQFIAGEVAELEVISEYIYETQFTGNAALFFTYNYQKMGTQNLVAEFSINNGAYQVLTSFPNGSGSPGYYLPSQLRDNPGTGGENIRYRFRLSNNEIDGSTFEITNFRIDINYSSGIFIYPNLSESGGTAGFEEQTGRRLLTTRDFTPEEMADAARITFEVDFDQLPVNLTASQYIAFEYSTDGGTSYTPLETYPETDAEVALSGDGFTYPITADMKENGVRFRWRQEEAKGDFFIENLNIIFGESLPFDYVDESISIAQQVLTVNAISAVEGCVDSEVTLDYEIKGRFGADNVVTVDYRNAGGTINPISGYEFNLVEGSGQVTFGFAGNTLSNTADNGIFKFRLSAEDETTDNTVNVDGNFSEESYELVAPVNTGSSFTVNDPLACAPEDVVVSIDAGSMQDYFMYEVLDAADGTVLGSLLRDPEDYQNEINIGQIAASTDLELRITSQSSNGTVCNTLIVDEESVEVLANFELYSYLDSDVNWKLVAGGSELTTCDGAEEVSLSVRRLLEDGSITTTGTTLVEWFRDDLDNLVATGTSIDDDGDIEVSGSYFARVTTVSCVYTTESIQINIAETPDQPVVTVVSGDLEACSSADPVVLAAPEGYDFYLWSNGATSRTISIEDQGSYSVQVSNVPFGTGCSSDASASIDVDRYDVPEFAVRNDNTTTLIGAGEVINVCESIDIEFMDGTSFGNNGNVQVIKDGAVYATTDEDDYEITESGVYSFVWNFDALNVDGCTATSVEFTVNILEQPTEAPALTSTGDLSFCAGEGTVVLTAPTGSDYYRWRRDGTTITNSTQGLVNTNTLEVSNAGSYTVEVGNAAGCYSPQSNAIVVTVVAEPSIPGLSQVNTTCGAGEVEFSIFNGNTAAMTYQLYNGNTGIASGNPVTIQSGSSGIAVTDVVEEDNTPFYVEVSYADGTGCSNVNPAIFSYGSVRNITLEMNDSRLIATFDGSATVRWYRNGVLMINSTSNSIIITDNAEYTVEVEYTSGCIITGSSADLDERVLANRSGVSMDVNTYPNPSSSEVNLNIVSEYMGKHQLVITTMTGQVMKSDSFEKNSLEAKHMISISDLESGIYMLQIQYEGLVKNVRIIKN